VEQHVTTGVSDRRLEATSSRNRSTTVVVPRSAWRSLRLDEVWQQRELLLYLVWRDIRVRYAQAVLGIAWTVIQPLALMLIFTFVFSYLAHVQAPGNIPYAVVSFAGLVPWLYASQAIGRGSTSVVSNVSLVSKIYVPRLIIPTAGVFAPLADLLVAFGVLLALLAAYGRAPSWHIVALPAFILFAVAIALAAVLWLSALNVRYRDVTYLVPVFLQLWMYASPVGYPSTLVPDRWHTLYLLNPLATVIEGFRWSVLGTGVLHAASIAGGAAIVALFLVGGLFFFSRAQRAFADII
jgi:lipopolysaccharide transport system permease protein